MAEIIAARTTARIEGPFVVFLIGMRINKPFKLGQWLPAVRAMGRMIGELYAAPAEVGFLGHSGLGWLSMVQSWRSFEQLERYASSRDHAHWPAWVAFNRRMKNSRGDVGIWHETYRVGPGDYEAIYSGMPPHGLGRAGRRAALTEADESARLRLGA